MITVEGNPEEMPAVPEDLHDMLEEGVELMHGRAMTAVLGNGKVEALATASGALLRRHQRLADHHRSRSSRRALRRRQRDHRRRTACVARLAAGRVQDRARHDQDRPLRTPRRHELLRRRRRRAARFRSAADGGERRRRRQARRVQSGQGAARRAAAAAHRFPSTSSSI